MRNIPKIQLIILAGDVALIAISIYLAPIIRFGLFLSPSEIFGLSDGVAVFVYLLTLYILDFYNPSERISRTNSIIRFATAILIVNLINSALFYVFNLRPSSSGILAISGSFSFVLLFLWRLSIVRVVPAAKPVRLLILGAGPTGRSLYSYLRSRTDFEVAGFIDDAYEKKEAVQGNMPVLGTADELSSLIEKHRIDQIIVATTRQIRPEVFQSLVSVKFGGIEVYEMPTFYERVAEKIPVLHTSSMWLGFADISGVKRNVYNTKLKKVFDKLISILGLIGALPVMILTALVIKLESRGPIFYMQERVGRDERIFELIKFRSMRTDAEKNGAVWAAENDPRVTRVGRVIRRLRIDELPQLWNVLRGDMSFVGPRPERMAFVKDLKREIPYYTLRHAIKPGITGWAQINYPYGASREDAMEKLQYDLYYIKNMSIIMDMYVILRTIRVMLFRKGAR